MISRIAAVVLLAGAGGGLGGVAAAQPVEFPKPNYCFAFLHAVAGRPELPEAEAMDIQKRHLAHLGWLWEKGWLEAAGPIVTAGGPRGILISHCKSVAEANELASADPAVQNKRLYVESHFWAGPAGIGERYRKEKAAKPDAEDRMTKHALVLLRKSATWSGWPPAEVFEAHFAHIAALKKAANAVAVGPFIEGGEWLGVFVFRDTPLDDARRLAQQDPMVRGGFARLEAYEWLVADGVFPER
ncbi:MAG: hypothetical protein KIT09_36020 [Bryobacteraceae bacterium]|nr:hypothetical protein [Bryobacteraceae bacterium]